MITATYVPCRAGCRYWDLPSLHDIYPDGGWLFETGEMNRGHANLAWKFIADCNTLGGWRGGSDFMRDMLAKDGTGEKLTRGMVRGVLNCVGGSLRANRQRFWKSRDARRDRMDGDENCLLCGGPLTGDIATARGMGDVCYRRMVTGE